MTAISIFHATRAGLVAVAVAAASVALLGGASPALAASTETLI